MRCSQWQHVNGINPSCEPSQCELNVLRIVTNDDSTGRSSTHDATKPLGQPTNQDHTEEYAVVGLVAALGQESVTPMPRLRRQTLHDPQPSYQRWSEWPGRRRVDCIALRQVIICWACRLCPGSPLLIAGSVHRKRAVHPLTTRAVWSVCASRGLTSLIPRRTSVLSQIRTKGTRMKPGRSRMDSILDTSTHLCEGCDRIHDAAVWFYRADSLASPQVRCWLCSTRFHKLSEVERLRWRLSVWD